MIKKIFSKKSASKTAETHSDVLPDSLPLDAFQIAMQYHQSGDLAQADALYRRILQHDPNHPDALHYLGVLAYQVGQNAAAVELISQAIGVYPTASSMYCNLGLALQALGKLDSAAENYRKAVELQPDYIEAHNNLGNVFVVQNKIEAAIESYRQVLSLKPDYAEVHNNLGCLLKAQGKLSEAIESFQHLLALKPDNAAGYYNLGTVFNEQNDLEMAVHHYQQAVARKPDYAGAYYNLAVTLKSQGKLDAAIENFQAAISLKPDYADAYNNLGISLQAQGKLNLAIENFQKAISIRPDYADAYNNLGLAFQTLGKLEAAVENIQRAISVKPDYANAYYNLGTTRYQQRILDVAIETYQKALALQPDHAEASDMLFHTQLHCCDWSSYRNSSEKILKAIISGEQSYNPFNFLAISSSAVAQKQCAKSFAKKYPPSETPVWTGQLYQHHKIRVAYLSGDFREHPVSLLIVGLLEQHDAERFEIIAISLSPEDKSVIGQRVKAAFDQFIEVTHYSDREIAVLMCELEVDIAVDLNGFTQNCRPGIFSHRPAPVQVNYLGYPATMGVDYIDYIVADKQIIPLEQQIHYTEKVVYLPDSYLVNDSKRVIAEYTPTCAEVNLPETGFVFCCFNNSYKITPDVFAVWMSLLGKIEYSVLWLSEGNALVTDNLRKEALLRGIAPERLIFAPRLKKLEDHFARHGLADLFLDTLPYNAHTTASDALWVGLPVLTCIGNAFAGRVAASLLKAVGLPELIAQNLEEYEALAFKLATTPPLLAEIRAKLAKNRTTYPLFDTDRFRRHIEAAYITMWERQQRGELPVSFAVSPIE
jgi:protein O-GlcNAc transferase